MTLEREVTPIKSGGRGRLTLGVLTATALGALTVWTASVAFDHVDTIVRETEHRARSFGRWLAPECVRDDDCVLRPSVITCCGTCAPIRPFEAIPVARLDQILRDAETVCVTPSRHCEPPVCPDLDPDIEARAVCTANVCRAVEVPPSTWIAGPPGALE